MYSEETQGVTRELLGVTEPDAQTMLGMVEPKISELNARIESLRSQMVSQEDLQRQIEESEVSLRRYEQARSEYAAVANPIVQEEVQPEVPVE